MSQKIPQEDFFTQESSFSLFFIRQQNKGHALSIQRGAQQANGVVAGAIFKINKVCGTNHTFTYNKQQANRHPQSLWPLDSI
jgi:hypothetical protein